MADRFRWIGLNRQQIAGLIAEGALPREVTEVSLPFPNVHDVYVGCESVGGLDHPRVVVLKPDTGREVLAWLSTYSLPSFPLSQSLRSLSTDDLTHGTWEQPTGRKSEDPLTTWACIVFGELLGQSELSTQPNAVALSRAQSCFSFALARATLLHGTDSWLATECEQRLKVLERDRLFVRRSIAIEDLIPLWSTHRSTAGLNPTQHELTRVVRSIVRGEWAHAPVPLSQTLLATNFDPQALATGSIESRVRAFQAFAPAVAKMREEGASKSAPMLLAAAAVCVGNGTSHISLLEEFGTQMPVVYAWFGSFACAAASVGWDPLWNRAVNSMRRMLRSPFDLGESPTCDLSWLEYDFVREVSKPMEFVKHFPKLFPKALSIEVVPGAPCQLRMASESAPASPSSRLPTPAQRPPDRPAAELAESLKRALSAEATASLYELDRALARSQALIRQTLMAADAPDQASLFDQSSKNKKRQARKSNARGQASPKT